MDMRSYRFALVPRRQWQNLYRGYKEDIEHYLWVLLKKTGAYIQRMEKTKRYVYLRVLLPESTDPQKAIAWVKRKSADALFAKLKRAGFMSGDKLDLWSERHYMDTGADERHRGDMETFVGDELLSKQQRDQIEEYGKRKGATVEAVPSGR